MNKKGQTLVLFVIFLPVIIILCSILIDESLIYYNKVKLSSLTRTIIKNNIDTQDKNDIIKLYRDNNIEDEIIVKITDGINVKFETQIDSFLGNIINKDKYVIKINIKGYKEDNKIKFKKGN